ncbi:Imm53 family immunity protein [Polymorphospora rubra]|uniref:Imm53 family immunity protein n=1 Tax=Polymorphospora rubra TaxID=338584 RepID=UPI003CCECED2
MAFLQSWYREQCDEEWEHEYGVRITTLDNPGWLVEIDLIGTEMEGCVREWSRTESSTGRWLGYGSDGKRVPRGVRHRVTGTGDRGVPHIRLGR